MFNDLHHIGIVVEDIDAAEKFYENILGLTKTHREVIPDQAIEAEAQAQALCMHTQDFKRAYAAFIAKEKPVFEGN